MKCFSNLVINSFIDFTNIENVNTANTFGYVNYETDQFETYSNVEGSAGNYTSIASKIYKPLSGDTLIVVVVIILGAVILFVFPLMTMSDNTDDITQLTVETAVTEFVDDIRTTGKYF